MSWAVGFDSQWNRDIGYGVPAWCDHPRCNAVIDRGLTYVCGGEPYGGDHGCGLYFCPQHLGYRRTQLPNQLCSRCQNYRLPFTAKPDHQDWIQHKLTHASWQQWRDENPDDVKGLALTLLERFAAAI